MLRFAFIANSKETFQHQIFFLGGKFKSLSTSRKTRDDMINVRFYYFVFRIEFWFVSRAKNK